MTAIDKMSKGTYKVSGNGRIIAYSTNGELYNTEASGYLIWREPMIIQ